jgi:hypothetical protein
MSSSAISKNSCSPDRPLFSRARIDSSYAAPLLIAWSKMVGFDVSPVTDSSAM